jgi:hypothetical protein
VSDTVSLLSPAISEPELRGQIRTKEQLELLESAYFNAVAAAAGCVVFTSAYDDGIDAIVKHRSPLHATGPKNSVDAFLQIQLKCISSTPPNPKSGNVSRSFENERFELWAETNPSIRKIVVMMIAPADPASWLTASHESLILRHCAYWCCIEGRTPTGEKTTSVSAPTTQIFDDVALCRIMHTVGQGGAL